MRLGRRLVFILLILAGIGLAGAALLAIQFRRPHSPGAGPVVVEIPPGSRSSAVVRLLRQRDVIDNEFAAAAYLILSAERGKLQAGEYRFDKPASIAEVLDKIAAGRVYLHKFTVPEGVTLQETAVKWQEQGFGSSMEFLDAARDSVDLVRDLDGESQTLEGYLFPETYSFPARTPSRKAIEAMVARFREVIGKLRQTIPPGLWPASVRQRVILASIVESEAAHDDERPLIASVYENRLQKKMLLQCDTTVIYALERENRYRGTLTLKDLKFDSRYNTYVYPGLPPGAIMNPGYASLQAAFRPATTNYIYFVRTTGGHHIFSETLAAHNFAVAQYRAQHRN